MMLSTYSVKAAAHALGVDPRTVRRWITAGQAPGAQQVQTPTGPAWTLPLATVEALRSKVARVVELVPQIEPVHRAQVEAHLALPPPAPAQGPTDTGALAAVRVALESQAATIAGQLAQLDAARDDALWWRCEAIGLREQLDQARAELAAAQVELVHLRRIVELHHRPTIPLDQLRQLRAAA